MISGVIGGCVCGMAVWLYLSSREEGGLAAEYFVKNTGKVILIKKPGVPFPKEIRRCQSYLLTIPINLL